MPPWEDEQVPYGDMDAPPSEDELMGASFPQPRAQAAPRPAAPQAQAAPRPVHVPRPESTPARAAVPSAPSASAPAAAPAPGPAESGGDKTPDELQAILQAGFGGGVTFEEVTQ